MGEYWYNSRTGEVEKGKQSHAIERVGPFDSAEEAANAPQVMQQRAEAWAAEEAREEEDGW